MSQPTPPDPFGDISITRPEASVPVRKPARTLREQQPAPSSPRQGLPPKQKKPLPLSLVLALLGLVAVTYLVCGYLVVPHLLKSVIPQALARRLDRPVTIGQADFNPFSLRLTLINGIIGPRLSDPTDKVDPLLSFASLGLDLEALSLAKGALICRELTLNQPFIHLVHSPDNRYNIASLLETNDQPGRLPLASRLSAIMAQRYAINNITINKGEILYDDLPTAKVHHLEEVDITLPAIANISYRVGELRPRVSAVVNGTPIELHGQAQMTDGPMTARLNLKMTNLDLAPYTNYLPAGLGVHTMSGQADLDLDLLYDAAQTEKLRLIGAIALRTVQGQAEQGQFSVESGVVKGWVAPLTNQFHADDITLHQPIWQRPEGQAMPWPSLIAAILHPDPNQRSVLAINHLQITKGETRSAAATPGQWSDWQAIDVSINTAARFPGDPNGPQQAFFTMNAKTGADSRITLQGSADTAPFSAKGLVVVNTIDIATVQGIWQGLGASLPVTGGVVEQIQANFSLTQDDGQRPVLVMDPISIQAKDLRIEQNGQMMEVPVWQSEQGSFTPADPILHLGKVRLQQARLTCRRQSDSGSWQTLWTPPEGAAPPPAGVDLNGLELTNGTLLIENQGPPAISLHLERFDLQVERLDPRQPNSVSAAAMVDNKYPLQATGTFSLAPFSASLNIQTSDLPLALFQPVLAHYFASPMDGILSAEGTLSLPALNFQGQWAIDSLSAPPISCRRLNGEGTVFNPRPLSLAIDRLTLNGPALQLTANPNGRPLLPAIMKSEWQPAPTPEAAIVALKAIDLADGSLIYDLPGPPGFTMGLRKITGSVSDFIVAKNQAIPFTLSGLMESTAEFQSQGTFTPFAAQPGLTLTSQVKGLPLTTLAPLLDPLWGFTIKTGTLDFDNKLTYEDTLIQDSSQLALHDLTLGKPLAAPAIKAIGTTWQSLPLIQAMLQDANGTIRLTVPIDGRTDTGFTYPGAMKTFLNQLLLKATVSPMNLLNDDQKALTDPVEFKPGSDRLNTAAEERLSDLVTLLRDRPLLAVSLTGFADSATDTKALLPTKKKGDAQPLPKGTGQSGQEALLSLATKRGRSVHELLTNRGLSSRQIRLTQPEVLTTDKAGRSGRRVTITLTP